MLFWLIVLAGCAFTVYSIASPTRNPRLRKCPGCDEGVVYVIHDGEIIDGPKLCVCCDGHGWLEAVR